LLTACLHSLIIPLFPSFRHSRSSATPSRSTWIQSPMIRIQHKSAAQCCLSSLISRSSRARSALLSLFSSNGRRCSDPLSILGPTTPVLSPSSQIKDVEASLPRFSIDLHTHPRLPPSGSRPRSICLAIKARRPQLFSPRTISTGHLISLSEQHSAELLSQILPRHNCES